MNRPYTLINVAITADGKMDTFERKGSAISSKQDKERVDQLRADADAVLVGGKTLLGEYPKLTVKSEALRESRVKRGMPPNPIKVGVVTSADIPLESDFIQAGPARVVIFTTSQTSSSHLETLRGGGVEVFVDEAPRVDLKKMMGRLREIGVKRLMVEGGGTINFELLRLGLIDELTIYIAPIILGGEHAPTLASGLGLARSEAIALKLTNVVSHRDGGILLNYTLEDTHEA
ncbi:MAG TPA: dihydrofolate reductase family protein [Anaerolineales bacterium]|nr:dihydrofolate reductase family protein [Anaerolineales bacterium]